jgi:hypothetical protein
VTGWTYGKDNAYPNNPDTPKPQNPKTPKPQMLSSVD